tara:strand:- start:42 stop:653 length:612 start_codon:yes stop_codon:yes gene_type:complete
MFHNVLYTGILNITKDSSFLLQSFRQLVQDVNMPIVYLFWGILFLVVLDIFHQLSGDATKYGYLVGKVMIEAFFYSLFFAIWTDYFQKRKLMSKVTLLNKTRKLLKLKSKITQPKFIFSFYFFVNNIIIVYYCPFYVFCFYFVCSFFIFLKMSRSIVPYILNTNDSHMYVNTKTNKDNIDAIIKWEYAPLPSSSSSQNWVILS